MTACHELSDRRPQALYVLSMSRHSFAVRLHLPLRATAQVYAPAYPTVVPVSDSHTILLVSRTCFYSRCDVLCCMPYRPMCAR